VKSFKERYLVFDDLDDKKGGSSYKVFMESNKAKASLPTPRLSSAGAGDGAAALLSAEIINDKLAKAAARRQVGHLYSIPLQDGVFNC